MAYLIECDRCGKTENLADTLATIPARWLQFNDVCLGDGMADAMHPPIRGGVFCERCVKDLRNWRAPLPREAKAYAG